MEEENMSALTSLVTKYTGLFLILIVLVSGTGAYFTLDVAGNALQATIRDELKTSAGIMATQVNATAVESLVPGDDGSSVYIGIAEQLARMRSANDRITNAYIMRVDDNQVITFVVDDFYLEDPGQTPVIGEMYSSPDQQNIFMALSIPTASNGVYTDKFGTFISGYAPIRDNNGNTIAVLGIDVEASGLVERIGAIRNAYIALLVGLVAVGTLVVFIISLTLARDINLLTRRVEEMQTGSRTVEIDIHRRDELGALSRAIARLEELIR
jgi:methyl-accepting chemotaxis protein